MIVRSDVPLGVQLAMTIHAAGWSAQLRDANDASPPTIAVALAATVDELAALAAALAGAAVPHVVVREPDEPWRNAVMAIGMVPMARAVARRFVARLDLAHRKDDRG